MPSSVITEKREYGRLQLKGDVLLDAEGSGSLLKASFDDISFGGFHITTTRRFETDEHVKFELDTEFLETPLQGTSKICYAEKTPSGMYSVGAQFIDTDPDKRRDMIKGALRIVIEARLRKEKLMKEMRLLAKIVPITVLLLITAMFIVNAIMPPDMSDDAEYGKKLRKAIVYYLYHPN